MDHVAAREFADLTALAARRVGDLQHARRQLPRRGVLADPLRRINAALGSEEMDLRVEVEPARARSSSAASP
jgi:hypothetical protein